MLRSRVTLILLLLAGVLSLLLAGCGGGGSTPPTDTGGTPDPPITSDMLRTPVEDPTQPGSIGGTLFSLEDSIIDYPYNATVTLTGQTSAGAPYTATATTSMRGTYSFPQVPAGTYTVAASAQSTRIPGLVLSASLPGVTARGNVPTLMTNLLLGVPASLVHFSGTITRAKDGSTVAGASVTADVSAFTSDHLNGTSEATVSVLISTTTDANGRYSLDIPASGLAYYIAAHSSTSMVSESSKMQNLTPGTQVVNLPLDDAITPRFGTLQLDMLSATLPAPTAAASTQALVTRLAVARALNAPANRISRLEKLVSSRATRSTRAGTGLVENDLYWSVLNGDVGTLGFNVYRASKATGPYTYLGSVMDPYLLLFFDNDPALPPLAPAYYTVTSFAANNQVSTPATPFLAQPLPQILPIGPDDGATVAKANAKITWEAVPGAMSYLVMVYLSAPPSFNMVPYRKPLVYQHGETAEDCSDLPPATYYWSVSAYNTTDPNYATAACYSAYRKMVIQ